MTKTALTKRTLNLSMSSLKCFLSCRRKYFLRYVEGLEPVKRARPLSMGGAFHKGLELLWSGQPLDAALKAVEDSYRPDERIEAGYDPDIAKIALGKFDEKSGWRQWGIQRAEKPFHLNMGYGLWLNGYIDAVASCDSRGGLLIETKHLSMCGDGYLNHLLWDDQASIYLYAARRMGIDCNGIMYNIVLKPGLKPYQATPEDKRKYNKDGTLSKVCRDQDETREEYLDRVKGWYDDATKQPFIQHTVYRNENQLREIENRIGQIAADIKAAYADESWYPNGQSCSILSCEYEGVCLEDTPEARTLFVTKDENKDKEVPSI